MGGEASSLQGGPHADREFMHTSLPFIGSAYEELRRSGVRREKIITICQLGDYVDDTVEAWLRAQPDIAQRRFIEQQRTRTRAACARLIDEGGSDYDRNDVNPATVISVLTGKAHGRGGRVVPLDHSGPIVFANYSHGDSHGAEWFAHLPYPSPVGNDHLLDFVAVSGSGSNNRGEILAPFLLYGTQLRVVFHELFSRQPSRPVVGLLNFCRAGGVADFMRRPAEVNYLGLAAWPLYLMCSSGAGADSLVGGFWEAWFCALKQSATTDAAAATAGKTSGAEEGGSCATVADLFRAATRGYYRANVYELMNEVKQRCFSRRVWELSFKFRGRKPGDFDPWHIDLKRALLAGLAESVSMAAAAGAAPHPVPSHSPSGGGGGDGGWADRAALEELEEAYRSGRAFRVARRGAAAALGLDLDEGAADLDDVDSGAEGRVVIWAGRGGGGGGPLRFATLAGTRPFRCELTAWQGPEAGRPVALAAVVRAALGAIARPECALGEHSGVARVPTTALFLGS